jgi:hypothetical protein
MGRTRKLITTASAFGGLAAAWLAGAAPVWQHFTLHR